MRVSLYYSHSFNESGSESNERDRNLLLPLNFLTKNKEAKALL